jgi:hypothetical protein
MQGKGKRITAGQEGCPAAVIAGILQACLLMRSKQARQPRASLPAGQEQAGLLQPLR